MDKDTIAEFLRDVGSGDENSIEIVENLLPALDGQTAGTRKVTVALQNRKLQPEPPAAPERAESPPRRHVFHVMAGMVVYLDGERDKLDEGGRQLVLVDVPGQEITAVLDDRAGEGFEAVYMRPQIHPLFVPWERLLMDDEGGQLRLMDFAEFIARYRRQVIQPESRGLVLSLSQVRASEETTIHNGRGASALNGVLVKTKISGETVEQETVELPEVIKVKCPLYVGTEAVEFEVDLTLGVVDGEVWVAVSSSDLIEAKLMAFEEMVAQLPADEDNLVIAYGASDYAEWKYVK